jgi:hypothetical protein
MSTTETQEAAMAKAEPQKEHEWLHKLVGEWSYEFVAGEVEGAPEKVTGTESVRSLGGLWVLLEGRGQVPGGGEHVSLMTLGYDPQKGHYVGTWVGSMMTHLWVYTAGRLDAKERVLTLESEGPDMSGKGGMAQYRDVIELVSDDHRVLTGNLRDADGSWRQMMRVDYRRTK